MKVRLRPITQTPTMQALRTKPRINPKTPNKVIYTIFAGRQYFLEILFVYLNKLIERNLIHAVHIWDFARNDDDSNFIKTMDGVGVYKVFSPKDKHSWGEYYIYYAQPGILDDNDIIIKSDDDIVYIDVEEFSNFLGQVDNDGMYFPNIVNNDVCAYLQTLNKVHNFLPLTTFNNQRGCGVPLTGWEDGWFKHEYSADIILNDFYKNKQKYKINTDIFIWDSRISINMFAMYGATARVYFNTFIENDKTFDDETYLSGYIYNVPHMYAYNSFIVPFFNVVHFSFGPQNNASLVNRHLLKYKSLADGIPYKENNFTYVWSSLSKSLYVKPRGVRNVSNSKDTAVIYPYNNKFIIIKNTDFAGNDIYTIPCKSLDLLPNIIEFNTP